MIDSFYNVMPETIQSIGEFTISWNLFERYYLDNAASTDNIDSLNLNVFKMEEEVDRFRVLLTAFFQERCNVIDDVAVQKLLFTEKCKGRKAKIRRIIDFLTGDIIDNHIALICIYRIRNNLLHGEKEIFIINEQRELIQSAADVLEVLTNWANYLRYEREKLDE